MSEVMEEFRNETKRRKAARGSVKNEARLDAFKNSHGQGGADWGTCDADRLQAVVGAITRLGGAVTIGLSRDQGAHSMTLLLDKQRVTLWFNGDADLSEEMVKVLAILEGMS